MDFEKKDFNCLISGSTHKQNKIGAENKEQNLTCVLPARENILNFVEELSNRNFLIIELENEIYQLKS